MWAGSRRGARTTRYPVRFQLGGIIILHRIWQAILFLMICVLAACGALDGAQEEDDRDTPAPAQRVFPDLAIHWPQVERPEFGLGSEPFDLSFIVANQGDGPSIETVTSVELELEASPGEFESVHREEVRTPALDRGASREFSLSFSWWGEVPFGQHRLVITADATSLLDQENVDNDRVELDLSVPHPCEDPDARVVFADARLEAAIAGTLELSTTSVTCDELQDLHHLYAGYQEITSLEGIEAASRLFTLDIVGNSISTLAPLERVGSLRSLWVSGVLPADLEVIGGLTHLSELAIWDSGVQDVSFLTGLSGLEMLDLAGNLVTDISPLESIPTLGRLGLDMNPVMDLRPLGGLPALWWLSLREVPAHDWRVLATLENLDVLLLGQNPSLDLDHLPLGLSNLRIDGTALADLSFLEPMTDLRSLSLISGGLSDASALTVHRSLEYLELIANRISDISFVTALPDLYYLGLSDNEITDLSPLLDHEGTRDDLIIYLDSNCLDLAPGAPAHQVVTELAARGVTVRADWQKECGNGG